MDILYNGENREIQIPEDQTLVLTSGVKNKLKNNIQVDIMAITLDFNDRPKYGALDLFFYGTGIYNNIPYGSSYFNHNESLKMLPFLPDCNEQKIEINFSKIEDDVKKIIFVQNIFNANIENINFGDLELPFFKISESSNSKEGVYFEADNVLNNVTCLQMCEIYRHNGIFKVRALGQGYSKGIRAALSGFSFDI